MKPSSINDYHAAVWRAWRALESLIYLRNLPQSSTCWRGIMHSCTHSIQGETGSIGLNMKESPYTWRSWGGITIVEMLHYANALWFLCDSAGKLDDVL